MDIKNILTKIDEMTAHNHRVATPDNPRNQPCPTCGRENVLTPKDVELGYQCNRCADQMERGLYMYESSNKKSFKDYVSLVQDKTLNEQITTRSRPVGIVTNPSQPPSGETVVLRTRPGTNPAIQQMLDTVTASNAVLAVRPQGQPTANANPSGQTTSTQTTSTQPVKEEMGKIILPPFHTPYNKPGSEHHRIAHVAFENDKYVVLYQGSPPKKAEYFTDKNAAVEAAKRYVGIPITPEKLDEKITKKTSAGKIIKDFEKSKDPKFKGKSKEERKKMALGAYYGMHPEKSKGKKSLKRKKKMHEAERPSDQSDLGPNLSAGRIASDMRDAARATKPGKKHRPNTIYETDNVQQKMGNIMKNTSKKKVQESVDSKLEAAYHEGKSHGLSKHGYACRYNEGSEEHKRYHKGFVEGLDECYGMSSAPIQGLVGEESLPATVPGMASDEMHTGFGLDEEILMDDEIDEMIADLESEVEEGNAFGAAVRKAKADGIQPGETITVGGKTYPVTEEDDFAFESLDRELQRLLTEGEEPVTEGLSVSMSTGQPGMQGDSVSVTATDDDANNLLDFVKKVALGGMSDDVPSEKPIVAVARSDYGAPAHSHDSEQSDMLALVKKMSGGDYEQEASDEDHEQPCNECGMHESKCGCEKEKMQEVQTPDQMTDEVAEDDSGDSDQNAIGNTEAEIDSSLAAADQKDNTVTVNEWANDAGKKGTDESFTQDINFMTKVISGGLNKPKSTGQTTIPVVAGQMSRMGADALEGAKDPIAEWQKLSGIK